MEIGDGNYRKIQCPKLQAFINSERLILNFPNTTDLVLTKSWYFVNPATYLLMQTMSRAKTSSSHYSSESRTVARHTDFRYKRMLCMVNMYLPANTII